MREKSRQITDGEGRRIEITKSGCQIDMLAVFHTCKLAQRRARIHHLLEVILKPESLAAPHEPPIWLASHAWWGWLGHHATYPSVNQKNLHSEIYNLHPFSALLIHPFFGAVVYRCCAPHRCSLALEVSLPRTIIQSTLSRSRTIHSRLSIMRGLSL